jgi:hypothetical protein
MEITDLEERARFFDRKRNQYGVLVKRKYHQTTCWVMLYDDWSIEELTTSDLKTINKVSNNE